MFPLRPWGLRSSLGRGTLQAAPTACFQRSNAKFWRYSLSSPLTLVDSPPEKSCYACGIVKPVSCFYKAKAAKDGLFSSCKECANKYKRADKIKNPVRVQTLSMFIQARRRAKRKNLPFDIDKEFVRSIVTTHCPVFGMPLEWSCMRGGKSTALPNSPSLDRIDPTKGYIKGNVWIISHRANQIKSDASHDELKLVAKATGEALVDSLEF